LAAGDDRAEGYEGMTLVEARARVAQLRGQLAKGIDPKAKQPGEAIHTFAEAAERYIATKIAPVSKGGRQAMQWRSCFRDHAKSLLEIDVAAIGRAHVLACVEPIWLTMNPTASRLRARIEAVLSSARVRGWRDGDNPALWRDGLEHVLANPSDVHQEVGYAALDWRQAPAFAANLRDIPGDNARMVEIALQCGTRTRPVREMRWQQIDLDQRLWTVPAVYEKTDKALLVPLSDHLVEILLARRPGDVEQDDVVFPTPPPYAADRKHIRSKNTLLRTLRKLHVNSTVHGFRATFRQWAKAHGYGDLAEEALSHVVGTKVQRAYTRTEDAYALRRDMMQAWSDYLRGAQIIKLGERQAA
jgi:integrase